MGEPRYDEAMANLDLTGKVMAEGATIAPDFVMRTVIGLRSILELHRPVDLGNATWCLLCETKVWPCPTAQAALDVLGVPSEEADHG